jgi:glutathione S-transferase
MPRQLYELAAQADDHVFSPYCWRIRLALAHKGLDFESVPWRMTEKERLAFSGSERVPVLVDGNTTVVDSWEILNYLEQTYPEQPLGLSRAEVRFVRHWTEMVLHPGLSRMIVDEVFQTVHEKDRAYFRESREKLFGVPLEEFAANKEVKLEEFRRALSPLRATLEAHDFLGGSAPNVSDYLVFSGLMWARCTAPTPVLAPDDPVSRWRESMLDLYEGMARRAPCREAA